MVAPPLVLHSPARRCWPRPGSCCGRPCWSPVRPTGRRRKWWPPRCRSRTPARTASRSTPPPPRTWTQPRRGRRSPRGTWPSPLLKEIAGWARSSGLRGPVQSPPPGNFAELAGVAVTFQYLNRMVTIFLPESPLPPMTPEGDWRLGHGHARLGHDLGQSRPRCLARTAARCAAARGVLLGGRRFPHRGDAGRRGRGHRGRGGTGRHDRRSASLVADRLRTWDGQPQGPSRAWADEAVAVLDEADRPAGLLAILTAFASYQVGKVDVTASGQPSSPETRR